MSDDSKLSFDQEIRVHALNLATSMRRTDLRLTAGNGPDWLAQVAVRDAAVFAAYLADGEIPPVPPVVGSQESTGAAE